jgi:hypothetical protein
VTPINTSTNTAGPAIPFPDGLNDIAIAPAGGAACPHPRHSTRLADRRTQYRPLGDSLGAQMVTTIALNLTRNPISQDERDDNYLAQSHGVRQRLPHQPSGLLLGSRGLLGAAGRLPVWYVCSNGLMGDQGKKPYTSPPLHIDPHAPDA